MQIQNVQINNILSIEDMKLGFNDSGLVLIDGWNHDRNSANGAGKSSIFDSIAFCLYGKLPRKITASEIVRKGTKKGSVTVNFTSNDGEWSVTRSRPKAIQYVLNGKIQNITQEEFEKKIKLNYLQFMIVMYAAQTPVNKFVSLNDSDKKQFLLDLMDLSSFKEKKYAVDNTIKELKVKQTKVEYAIGQCESAILAYKESLVDVTSINIEKQDIENSVLNIITEIKNLDLTEPNASYITTERATLDRELINLELVDSNRKKCLHKVSQYESDLQRLTALKVELPNVIQCPGCGDEFCASDTSVTIERLEAAKESKIQNITDRIKDIEIQEDVSERIQGVKMAQRDLYTKQQDMMRMYRGNIQTESSLKSKLSSMKSQLQILDHTIDQQNGILDKISSTKDSQTTAEGYRKTISDDLQLNETISAMLSPMGASAYIMDSILDKFNSSLEDYLLQVWPNITYMLESFKENKNGDIRSKFSDILTIDGHTRSVGSLSGGERAALSLVVDFAITDLMSEIFGIILNPIILDEPFYGLDAASREVIINILDRLSKDRAVYVIDHFSESKSMFNETVEIHKKGGISSMV